MPDVCAIITGDGEKKMVARFGRLLKSWLNTKLLGVKADKEGRVNAYEITSPRWLKLIK